MAIMNFWLSIFIANLLGLVELQRSDLYDRLFIRQQFDDLILKEDEIVTFVLKDYFGGSFLNYFYYLLPVGEDQQELSADQDEFDIFQVNTPFENVLSGGFENTFTYNPLKEMTLLLKEHNDFSLDRTMLMFIDETYYLNIVDFTDHNTKQYKLLYRRDLLRIINNKFGSGANTSKCLNTKIYQT